MKFWIKMGFYLMKFNNMLGDSTLIPNLMQTIGLALLTVLIPLAIAILNDPLQKKKGKNADFVVLDIHVILDEVFQFKYILISIGLIFLPLFFWKTLPVILLILCCWGIYNLVRIIFNTYKWTKGNVFEFRFSYLKNLKKNEKSKRF